MKAFVVVAMLVACVAGQSMETMKLNKDMTSMLKFDRPTYPMVRDTNNWMDNFVRGGDYEQYDTTTVYQLHEIMSHPLFREYMSLPLFRQYWTYPVFQKYVASIYFQRFWTIPAFQQYFVNPTYFYKYIYPIVNLFKYDTTTVNAYPFQQYNTQYDYYYGQERDLLNFNRYPVVCHYNSVYCKALLEKFYNHFSTLMTYYGQEETETTPYMYNPIVAHMIQGYYGKYPTTYQTEKYYPFAYNYERMFNGDNAVYNKNYNTFETEKMVDDVTPFGVRYEHIRPTYMGKTFDKKFYPETIIKA